MTIDRQFSHGLRWVAGSRLLGQLVSWVGTIYVMRTLVPHDYGLAAICSTVLAITSMVSEVGIGAGIIQAEKVNDRQLRSIFGVALMLAFCATSLVTFSAPWLAIFFNAPEAVPLIRVASLQLLLSPLTTIPEAYLLRDLRFRSTALTDFSVAIASSTTTVSLAWSGAGVWALIIGPLVGGTLRVLILQTLSPHLILPSFDPRPARGLVGFGSKIATSRVASYLFSQSDVLIASRALTKSALGEYSVAMNLAMLPVSKVMSVVNSVTYPTIARMNRNKVDIPARMLSAMRLFGYCVIPVLWGMSAVAPWLIQALIGDAWANAVLPLQIVCLAMPARLMGALLSSVVQGLGHAGLDVRNTVTGVIVMPVCFLVGAQFGASGLALAWMIGLPCVVAINVHHSRHVLGVTLLQLLRAFSKPLCFSGLMALNVYVFGHWAAAHFAAMLVLPLCILLGITLYLGFFYFFDRATLRTLLAILRPNKEGPPAPDEI